MLDGRERPRAETRTQWCIFRKAQADLGREWRGFAEHAEVSHSKGQSHGFFHFDDHSFFFLFDIGGLHETNAS